MSNFGGLLPLACVRHIGRADDAFDLVEARDLWRQASCGIQAKGRTLARREARITWVEGLGVRGLGFSRQNDLLQQYLMIAIFTFRAHQLGPFDTCRNGPMFRSS